MTGRNVGGKFSKYTEQLELAMLKLGMLLDFILVVVSGTQRMVIRKDVQVLPP